MAFNCPACRRPLYNRRRATCEFCSAPIPASLLLTAGQQARVEAMKQSDRSRHREAMTREFPGGGGDFGSAGFDLGGGDCGGGDCGCG